MTNSNIDFPLVDPLQPDYGGGESDAYIAKLSVDGATILYSSYLGGGNEDEGVAIRINDESQIVVAGNSRSWDYPTAHAMQGKLNGDQDIVVTRLSEDGRTLIFSTYLGGRHEDQVSAMALDRNGDIALTGSSRSRDYPLTENALQSLLGQKGSRHRNKKYKGDNAMDAVLTRIRADGQALLYSSYLGGHEHDAGTGIVIDPDGYILLSGNTDSHDDFPVTEDALQPYYGGGESDGFIAKFSPEGDRLIYASYLGGKQEDLTTGVATDGAGFIYITGSTKSKSGFPLLAPIQSQLGGDPSGHRRFKKSRTGRSDAFVTHLVPQGNVILYSTYFGGRQSDAGTDITADIAGNVYITGWTNSRDLALHQPLQPDHGGRTDAFIVKLHTLNQAPVILSTPIKSGTTQIPYAYQVDAEDPDGDPLFYSLAQAPAGMQIDTVTGLLKWTPSTGGDYQVVIEVTDRRAFVDQDFTLSINTPPQILSTPLTLATLNKPYNYDVNAKDLDGDPLTYSLIAAPAGMTVDGVTGVINWTPISTDPATVTVRVEDNRGGSDTQTYSIEINSPPSIVSQAVTDVSVNEPYQYAVEAMDPDNDPLTFSLVTSPDGMTVDAASGVITWTPGNLGEFNVQVKVEDGRGGDASQSFTVTVASSNQPPVITSTPVTENHMGNGELYIYQIEATDPDGDPLSYSLDAAPVGMQINNYLPSPLPPALSPALPPPLPPDPIIDNLLFQLSTVNKDDPQSVASLISALNSGIDYLTQEIGDQVDLSTLTDLINELNTTGDLTLLQSITDSIINIRDQLIKTVPTITWMPNQAGVFDVTVRVADDKGASTTQKFAIAVFDANAPLIISKPVTDGFESIDYGYSVVAEDPNGDQLVYSLLSAPAGMQIDPDSGEISWTPTVKGDYPVTVLVGDGTYSTEQSFSIHIMTLTEADTKFQGIWNEMFQSLANGDKEAGLQYFTDSARSRYEPVIDVLMPYMQEIYTDAALPLRVSIIPDIAEYSVSKTIQGQKKIFLIYFMRNQDGDWQIDSM